MPQDLRLGITLTADGKGLAGEIRVAKKELDRLTGATQKSGEANRAQAGTAKQAGAATQKSGTANRAQAGTARQAGAATQKSSTANRAQARTARQAGAATQKSSAANRAQARTAKQAGAATDSLGKSFLRAHGRVVKYFGVAAGVGVAAAITRQADSYTDLNNRLRLVTGSSEGLLSARQELLALSQRTRTDVAVNAELYSRFSLASDALGRSQGELLTVTELLNKQVAIGGNTSSEAAAGLTQFAQGLASGRLAGDELKSVLENLQGVSSGLLIGFAKLRKEGKIDFDVTRANIRELAAEGKLSAALLLDAILASADDTNKKFAGVATTVGGALTQIGNATLFSIGAIDEGSSASQKFAGVLSGVATAIESFDARSLGQALSYTGKVATAVGIVFTARLLLAVKRYTATQYAATRSALVFQGALLSKANAMRAATVAARGLRSAMAFLGGPFGVIALAGYALYEFISAANDATPAAKRFDERLRGVRETAQSIADLDISDEAKAISLAAKVALANDEVAAGVKLVTELEAALERLNQQNEDAKNKKTRPVVITSGVGFPTIIEERIPFPDKEEIEKVTTEALNANTALNLARDNLTKATENQNDFTAGTKPRQAATEAYLKLQKSLQTEEQKINTIYAERIKILDDNADKAVDPEQLATARARVTAERDAALAAIDKTKADEAARASAAALRQANESGLPALAALQQRQRELGEVVDLSATSLQRQADITRATHRVQKNYATATDETRQAIVDLIVGNAEQERGLQRTASAYQLITGGADAYRQQLAAIREAADLVVDDPATAQNERTAALRQANLESERLYQEHLIEAKRLGWEAEILEAEGHYSRVEAATLAHKSRVIDIESGGFNKVASVRKGFADYEAKQATATRKQKAVSALAIAKESLGAVAGQNKKLFQLQQAAGIAQAIISIHTGVATALQKPPPLGFIEGALIAVAGAAEIAAIRSQQPPQAFALGGIVDRPTFFSASNVARGVAGEAGPEAIIPLRRGRGGRLGIEAPAGGATINLGGISLGDVIVQGGESSEETGIAVITQLQERLRPAVQEILAGELRPGGQLNRTNVAAA